METLRCESALNGRIDDTERERLSFMGDICLMSGGSDH